MLSKDQQAKWDQFRATLSREQEVWLAGYLQGAVLQAIPQSSSGAPVGEASQKLRIYFATETGNSKGIAQNLAKAAKKYDWNAQAMPIKRANLNELEGINEPVIFVVSTHGEGDPPEPAIAFFDALDKASNKLSSLSYAVLGLGDRSYPKFCEAARILDERLANLGAKTFQKRLDLDVDFHAHIGGWTESVLKALPSPHPQEVEDAWASMEGVPPVAGKGYSRLEPVKGVVAEIIKLNDQGSDKETYHIEIEYDEPLDYAPGDAAGIMLPHDENVALLTPRLYSIASSPAAHGNSIHLTVALAWHVKEDGTKGFGICSHFLSQLKAGD
ncbi:MAG: flavodoxin domain-containing protein, partial [Rickettsiales bacterium]